MTYRTVGTQEEILEAINALYLAGTGVYLDPMYGKGGFYRGSFPVPDFVSDVKPLVQGWPVIDARYLPFVTGTIPSMILDPPFMHALGKDSEMNRYGTYKSQKELRRLYVELLAEASRVLEPGGILVFKCQDTVESGKQVWVHTNIQQAAILYGFVPEDLFICVAKSRMTGHNHKKQKHARKFHSYFWVFRKKADRPGRPNVHRSDHDYIVDSKGQVWHQTPLEDEFWLTSLPS